jgi:hypothetical protein
MNHPHHEHTGTEIDEGMESTVYGADVVSGNRSPILSFGVSFCGGARGSQQQVVILIRFVSGDGHANKMTQHGIDTTTL